MLRNYTFLIVFLGLGVLTLTGMLAGFVPQDDGRLIRRAISPHVVKPTDADMPAPIFAQSNGARVWAVRKPVAQHAPGKKNIAPHPKNEHIVSFDKNGIHLNMARDTIILEANSNYYLPLLALDGISQPLLSGTQPSAYGDVLDTAGRPIRWFATDSILGYSPFRRIVQNKSLLSTLGEGQDDETTLHVQIKRYKNLVENFAQRYQLNMDLVFAIIYSESSFSPALISSKSAMGLMQLLPSTASDEVHRFLYGRPGSVDREELRMPETNIRYGTAYLHILLRRYFGDVREQDSREYCVIAAYNMGPNRFLRLYGKTNEEAIDNINSMSPDELYVDLTQRLPLKETRDYVAKVKRMKGTFAELIRSS